MNPSTFVLCTPRFRSRRVCQGSGRRRSEWEERETPRRAAGGQRRSARIRRSFSCPSALNSVCLSFKTYQGEFYAHTYSSIHTYTEMYLAHLTGLMKKVLV